jgi:hypothetical protein
MTGVFGHVPQAPTLPLSYMLPAPHVPSATPTMFPSPSHTGVSIDCSPVNPMRPPNAQFPLPTPHATPPREHGMTARARLSETILRGVASSQETRRRPNHPTGEAGVVTPRDLQSKRLKLKMAETALEVLRRQSEILGMEDTLEKQTPLVMNSAR